MASTAAYSGIFNLLLACVSYSASGRKLKCSFMTVMPNILSAVCEVAQDPLEHRQAKLKFGAVETRLASICSDCDETGSGLR
jgi:hypothetical protein